MKRSDERAEAYREASDHLLNTGAFMNDGPKKDAYLAVSKKLKKLAAQSEPIEK